MKATTIMATAVSTVRCVKKYFTSTFS